MISDLVELLDRQYLLLPEQQEPADFFYQLDAFMRFISGSAPLRAIAIDLTRDADARLERFRVNECQCVERLQDLGKRLVALVPALDDRTAPVAEDDDPESYYTGFTAFDRIAKEQPEIEWPSRRAQTSARPPEMFSILRGKGLDPRFEGKVERATFTNDLRSVAIDYNRASRAFELDAALHAGVAFRRLAQAVQFLIPSADDVSTWVMAADHLVATRVFDNPYPLDHGMRSVLDAVEPNKEHVDVAFLEETAALRKAARRLFEELRAGLVTVRSRLALVHRFRDRCQLHDANRLRKLAEQNTRPEDRLRDEFARWLFDQGMDPLTEPTIGALRPDILQQDSRDSLYVEAKQYKNHAGALRAFKDGAKQVWSTANRLHGNAMDLREAFLVVFRRSGPDCHLPTMPVRARGLQLYVVLVDIAPSSESGSRAAAAISISNDDLLGVDDRPSGTRQKPRRKPDRQ